MCIVCPPQTNAILSVKSSCQKLFPRQNAIVHLSEDFNLRQLKKMFFSGELVGLVVHVVLVVLVVNGVQHVHCDTVTVCISNFYFKKGVCDRFILTTVMTCCRQIVQPLWDSRTWLMFVTGVVATHKRRPSSTERSRAWIQTFKIKSWAHKSWTPDWPTPGTSSESICQYPHFRELRLWFSESMTIYAVHWP